MNAAQCMAFIHARNAFMSGQTRRAPDDAKIYKGKKKRLIGWMGMLCEEKKVALMLCSMEKCR